MDKLGGCVRSYSWSVLSLCYNFIHLIGYVRAQSRASASSRAPAPLRLSAERWWEIYYSLRDLPWKKARERAALRSAKRTQTPSHSLHHSRRSLSPFYVLDQGSKIRTSHAGLLFKIIILRKLLVCVRVYGCMCVLGAGGRLRSLGCVVSGRVGWVALEPSTRTRRQRWKAYRWGWGRGEYASPEACVLLGEESRTPDSPAVDYRLCRPDTPLSRFLWDPYAFLHLSDPGSAIVATLPRPLHTHLKKRGRFGGDSADQHIQWQPVRSCSPVRCLVSPIAKEKKKKEEEIRKSFDLVSILWFFLYPFLLYLYETR